MAYTFARVTAVLKLKLGDYSLQGKHARLRLLEKGNKEKLFWLHHEAEQYLDTYLEAAHISEAGAPVLLFLRVLFARGDCRMKTTCHVCLSLSLFLGGAVFCETVAPDPTRLMRVYEKAVSTSSNPLREGSKCFVVDSAGNVYVEISTHLIRDPGAIFTHAQPKKSAVRIFRRMLFGNANTCPNIANVPPLANVPLALLDLRLGRVLLFSRWRVLALSVAVVLTVVTQFGLTSAAIQKMPLALSNF
jgi:hypothetical protein